MASKTYDGSCHCGAVAFEAEIDLAQGTRRCNCSICAKARAWFIGIPADKMRAITGEDNLADYAWTPTGKTPIGLHYRFCKTCGIRLFAKGEEPSLGGPFYAVAIAALDGFEKEADVLADNITYVDGRHDNYREGAPPPADTRLM